MRDEGDHPQRRMRVGTDGRGRGGGGGERAVEAPLVELPLSRETEANRLRDSRNQIA